jgi:anti-anti-sigma factor
MEIDEASSAPVGQDLESAVIYEELPDADVVHVFGEFSFLNCVEIEKSMVRSVRIGRTHVTNLLGCTYLDAAGVSVLLRARRALGSTFSIVAPESGVVRRVLDITELTASS